MPETAYERILTLAKTEYEHRVKQLHITELEKIVYQSPEYVTMSAADRQRTIAKKVFKPLLKQYGDNPQKVLTYVQEVCGEAFELAIACNPAERELVTELVGEKKALGDLWKVSFKVTDTEKAHVYGFVGNKDYDLNVIGKKHPEINAVDLSSFFAGLYLYRQIYGELKRMRELSPRTRRRDAHYRYVMDFFLWKEQDWKVPLAASVSEMKEYYEEYLNKAYDYQESRGRKAPRNRYTAGRRMTQKYKDNDCFYYCLFQLMMAGEIPLIEYADLVEYSVFEKQGWLVLKLFHSLGFLDELYDCMVEDRSAILNNYQSYVVLGNDYAKSYETKKNQSDQLKKRIQESRLWKYFGYVEYDEDVDVKVIAQYEAEFEAFYEKHLQGIDLSQNAIRFRRLGQHNASGLYYPQVKCLCVDIKNPYSLVHELGHLIDYQLGSLSSQPEFRDLRCRVAEYLNELIEEGNPIASRLTGKTKYNLAYYLTPTEIFARSFELYSTYIWKEHSSILAEEYEDVYDCSKENLGAIRQYFDAVWKRYL